MYTCTCQINYFRVRVRVWVQCLLGRLCCTLTLLICFASSYILFRNWALVINSHGNSYHPGLSTECNINLSISAILIQFSFKKEVGVRVNDLVFWLTLWLNFEKKMIDFKWHMIMWQKCSMLISMRVATSSTNGSVFWCLKDLLWCFNEHDWFLLTTHNLPIPLLIRNVFYL